VCRVLPGTKQKSQVAAIAGGVVGAIIGTLLIVGLVLWLRKRRNNAANQRHSRGESDAPTATSQNPIVRRMPDHVSLDSSSLELPRQAPPPSAMVLSDGTTFPSPISGRSKSTRSGKHEDPRRGLVHDNFKKVDEENDGRLLDERPMGLSETIHSRGTLPRMAAEHTVE